MMIIIPVALVVVIMVGILIGILAGAGSSFTIAAVEKLSGTTTNYQLQLMMDSVSEDIVENSRAFEEGSALLEMCIRDRWYSMQSRSLAILRMKFA